jgi:hypothetical protein
MRLCPTPLTGRKAAAGFMLALWLATVLVSTLPALHEFLHDNSRSGQHECLVTDLAKGHVLFGESIGSIPVVAHVDIAVLPPVDLMFVFQPANRLSPSRAPPILFSSRKG